MDKNQILVLALANVPAMIAELIGILLNNGRLNDLNSRFSGLETRLAAWSTSSTRALICC